MSEIKAAVIQGDGVGPEMIRESGGTAMGP